VVHHFLLLPHLRLLLCDFSSDDNDDYHDLGLWRVMQQHQSHRYQVRSYYPREVVEAIVAVILTLMLMSLLTAALHQHLPCVDVVVSVSTVVASNGTHGRCTMYLYVLTQCTHQDLGSNRSRGHHREVDAEADDADAVIDDEIGRSSSSSSSSVVRVASVVVVAAAAPDSFG
jgi:hypothetical protein